MNLMKKLTNLAWIGIGLTIVGLLFGLFQGQILISFGERVHDTLFLVVFSVVLAGNLAVCAIMMAKKQWTSLLVTLVCAATLLIPF